MSEHYRKEDYTGDMPKHLRWVMSFIKEQGFPTLAFLMMFYMCFVTLKSVSLALTENTKVLVALTTKIDRMDR